MKTKQSKTKVAVTILVLASLAVLVPIALAGNLEPNAPPGPTMKTLDEVEPRIPIPASATPAGTFTISQSGSYYLTGDRNASENGIIVDVNDVTINLMGYNLIGPGSGLGKGIYMNGRSNVEIRNGTVRDFGTEGIHESASAGKKHRVIGVRVMSNGGSGIYLASSGHLVKDCTVAGNEGFAIQATSGSTVTGNTVYNNENAGIIATDGSTVTGNTVYNNPGFGISTGGGCTVIGNSVRGNKYYGIVTGYGNTIAGNTACYNDGDGSTVTGNTAYYNQNNGISFGFGGNNLVDQNTAYQNNQSGGSYSNMGPCPGCTLGLNHAP